MFLLGVDITRYLNKGITEDPKLLAKYKLKNTINKCSMDCNYSLTLRETQKELTIKLTFTNLLTY